MGSAAAASELAGDLFRRESARLIAALTRVLGPAHVALAEDAVQDALLAALGAWQTGVPDDPVAWLVRVASNRAIDELRRTQRRTRIQPALESATALAADLAGAAAADDPIDQVAMMFTCCHPDLALDTQVTLILRWLGGLGAREIAAALLVDVPTVERRLNRGRERVAELGALHDVRDPVAFAARAPAVLHAIYLLCSEGYHGSDHEGPVSAALCAEALRLLELVLAATRSTVPEGHALAALCCFSAARLPTRLDADGVLVPLADQDRAHWDRALIERGIAHLGRAATGARLSRWHLEAGIAAAHTLAPSLADTDWPAIVAMYDALHALHPSPVVALNRALAVAEHRGLAAGEAALAEVASDRLSAYPFYWAARADLARRAGRLTEARGLYERAITASRSPAERTSYARRLAQLDS